MRRRRIAGLLLAGLIVAPFARAARGADLSDAAAPIAQLNQGLLTVMKAGTATPFPHRFEMLAPVVERAFDLDAILKACVGPRWSSFSPREQAALIDVFRRFTVASYVANFAEYGGEHFDVARDGRPSAGGAVVETHIVAASGSTIRIDYLMRQEADAWRAVDVLLQGTISRVAVQRSDFRGLLASGPDASSLIGSLQQKVADLSGGTLSPG